MTPLNPPDKKAVILVVDDEEPVRRLIAKLLGLRHYTVLEANHGEAALAVSEGFPGAIHLLITDIMMPVMNGRELAERLARLRPELRVLFISGYPGTYLPGGIKPIQGEEFLSKPFRADALLSKVDGLLA